MMTRTHFLAPVVSLLIVSVMLGVQRQKISQLTKENVVLKSHIAAEQGHLQNQGVAATNPNRPTRPESAKDGIDWAEIAGIFSPNGQEEGIVERRKKSSLYKEIEKMSRDQIIAAFDVINALELSEGVREELEKLLIRSLASKDPEFVLNRFSDRFHDENFSAAIGFPKIFSEWVKKDQVAAIVWFDKALADGILEGKALDGESGIRNDFVANLVSQLISTDPALAQAKLNALPSKQRRAALLSLGDQMPEPKDQAAQADFIRANLRAKEAIMVFTEQAYKMAFYKSLDKVDVYLNEIGATGNDRSVIAETAAITNFKCSIRAGAKIPEEQIDSMRKWLGTQAPGSVNKLTGEALAYIGGSNRVELNNKEFSEAAALLMKYHEQGGGDDLLTGFLYGCRIGVNNPEIQKIVEKISDPQKREQMLELRNLKNQ